MALESNPRDATPVDSHSRRTRLFQGRWDLSFCRPKARPQSISNIQYPISANNGLDGAEISIWQEMWNEYFYKLHPDDQRCILQNQADPELTLERMEALIQSLQKSYSGKLSSICMNKIYPLASHIQSFGRALDILAQAGPSPILFVWGGLRLILEPSTRSIELHETILWKLEELSNYLPLFERWRNLFPEASYSALSKLIRRICLDFLAFVFEAIKFLRSNALANALRTLFVPSFQSEFVSIQRRIKSQTDSLHLQIQTAESEASKKRHAAMTELVQSTSAIQSPSDVRGTTPFKFLQCCTRNHDFWGREDEIAILRRQLACGLASKADVKQTSIVLHGSGGFGKSALALEYLYRDFETYPVILWLYAEKKERLDTQFIQVARLLGLCKDGNNADDSVELVQHWITKLDIDWLIVFDNADDVSIVTKYWPSSNHGSIIISSRNPYPENVAARLQIQKFDTDQGAEFLLSLLESLISPSESDRSAARSISQYYDGLPLGLRQAASYMKKRVIPPSAFLQIFEKQRENIEQTQIPGYTNTVADVWEMSLATLSSDSSDFLDTLVFLDPDVIPSRLFQNYGHNAKFTSFLTEQSRYFDAAGALHEQSLIDVNLERNSLSLHRFFQQATFRRLKRRTARFEEIYCAVAHIINRAVQDDDYLSMKHLATWEAVETYIAHAEVLYVRSSEGIPLSAVNSLLDLSGKIAGYYHETGQLASCEATLQRAMSLAEAHKEVDKMTFSKLYYYHGRCCQESNRTDDAIRDFERALSLVSNDVENLDALSHTTYLPILYENLGISSTGAGRYEGAERYLKKAIEMGKEPNSPVRCVMGDFLQCLGACYLWKGDLKSAENLLSRAILDRCGPNNENRGGALYSLGNVYLRQGRFDLALEMHQEVLRLYREDLGDDHHWVADSCHKVGSIYAIAEFKKLDLQKAEQLVRTSLSIWLSEMNAKNSISGPAATRSRWKLAQILTRMGGSHEKEAQGFFQEACNYVRDRKGKEISRDPADEAVVDELVFYWTR